MDEWREGDALTVAAVIRLATVVGEEGHGVVGGDKVRVLLDELANGLPEGGYGGLVFVQRDGEACVISYE